MSFFVLGALLNFLTSITFGSFIFFNNVKSRLNQLFAEMSLMIALWSLFYFFWQITSDYDRALLYVRILTLFACLIPVFYLHWIVRIVDIKNIIIDTIIIFAYVITFIFIFILVNNPSFLVLDVVPINIFQYWPIAGPLYILNLLSYATWVLMGIVILIYKMSFIEVNLIEKRRLKYILIGSIIGFGGGTTNFPLWYGIDILPFGNIFVSFYVVVVGYAVMRYNLMDIRMVLAQLLIVVLNFLAISFVFMSNSISEFIMQIIFALVIMGLSFVLLKSFNREIDQKEKLTNISNKLEDANEQLRQLDKAKSEFISIASHQLRTPLTAIKGYISLVLEGTYGKNSKEIISSLKKVFVANERLINLVEDLLNISRIESGRLEYHYTDDVHMDDVLEELKGPFVLRAEEKGLKFKIELPEKKLLPVRADQGKLREVISNLIDNALKYTEKGSIHISFEEKKDTALITVKDTGVGISKKSMQEIFNKFSRGSDETKIYADGTGLGLYVGKSLIESQGGRIYAQSDGIGKGSSFIIEMPLAKNNKPLVNKSAQTTTT